MLFISQYCMHVYLISFIIKQHIDSKYVIFRPFCEQNKKMKAFPLLYTKKTYYARGNFFQSTNSKKIDILFLFPINLIQFSEIIL